MSSDYEISSSAAAQETAQAIVTIAMPRSMLDDLDLATKDFLTSRSTLIRLAVIDLLGRWRQVKARQAPPASVMGLPS